MPGAGGPAGRPDQLGTEIGHVLDVAATLNAEPDPERLFGRILTAMRALTGADAGSLYVVEPGPSGERALSFRVAQNDTLGVADLPSGSLPVDATSVVGHVVLTGRPLNIPDTGRLSPDAPVAFNDAFDRRTGYRTVSLLTVPLLGPGGEVHGAVQLLNRKRVATERLTDPARTALQVLPFTPRDERLATGLAGAASIALANARLAADIRHLFDGFVRAAVFAIDARDPGTSGHSLRVSRLSLALADAAAESGRFPGELPFSEPRRRRLEYAALLHDFGKIGVPENLLLKARRLYPWELAALEQRFEVARLSQEVDTLRRLARGELDRGAAEDLLEAGRAEWAAALELARRANEPGPLTGEARAAVEALATRGYRDRDGEWQPLLTPRERECLTLPHGSLTPGERRAIEAHVVHTGRFLERIPWGRELSGLTEIAVRHHEMLDGSGYPAGLSAADIPLESRIIAVADIYDALTSTDRPYRGSLSPEVACDILWSEADRGRLDGALVEIFVERRVHDGPVPAR